MADNEKLIEAVRGYEVLYNTSNPDYMRTKLKDEIWLKIARQLKLSNGEEAKDAWSKLRNCHRDALRRQKKTKSGSGATSSKPWKFQKQMEFLLDHMQNRPRETNLNEVEDEYSEEQQENRQEEEDDDDGGEETQTEIKRISKRKREDDVATIIKASLARQELRAKERQMERTRRNDSSKNDELYHFYMSMYETTKRLPIHLQHVVKNKIFAIVSSSEAEHLNLSYNSYYYPQSESTSAQPPTVSTPQTSTSTQFSFESCDYPFSSQSKPTSTPLPENSQQTDSNFSTYIFHK